MEQEFQILPSLCAGRVPIRGGHANSAEDHVLQGVKMVRCHPGAVCQNKELSQHYHFHKAAASLTTATRLAHSAASLYISVGYRC